MAVQKIPVGYEGLTPSLCCKDAKVAMAFYEKALGAKELFRMDMPDGRIGHAEMQIGPARFMLSDEFPDWNCLSPKSIGGTATSLMIYVEDVDAAFARAVEAGAKVIMAPQDQFYGDRSGKFEDPSGHTWFLATHIEDVPPEELARRAKECFG